MRVEQLSDEAPVDDAPGVREVLWVEALLYAWGRWVKDGGLDALAGYDCPLGRLIKRGGGSGRVVSGRVLDVRGIDELGLCVERGLMDLPTKQRELLRKYYAVGLTWEQVAQELRVNKRTIYRWKGAAVEALMPTLRRFESGC